MAATARVLQVPPYLAFSDPFLYIQMTDHSAVEHSSWGGPRCSAWTWNGVWIKGIHKRRQRVESSTQGLTGIISPRVIFKTQ